MKRLMLLLTLMCFSMGLLLAVNQSSFRFGFYGPSDSNAGMMLGASRGTFVDERVEIFGSGDFFFRTYTQDKKINTTTTPGGSEISTIKRSADISTYYLPLMGNIRVKFPYNKTFSPYVGGGIGWSMAWEDVFIAEDSLTSKIDDVNFFNGFAANLNSGVILPLGSKSDVYFEAFYNWSNCKRNQKETSAGIFWDELNMSGLGIRMGLAFKY